MTVAATPVALPAIRTGRHRPRFQWRRPLWALAGWAVGVIFFIPILWMVLTSFKTETAAYSYPPKWVFHPTLTEYNQVFSRGIGPFLENSIYATVGSVILALLLAVPAAYALSVRPVKKWRDGMFFFISTKMLPYVAAIVPLYVLAKDIGLLDNVLLLLILYTAMNLPLAVWMMRSFLLEVPVEILEAARLDGAGFWREITEVMLPIAGPGLAATALICIIFAWNEFFLAINLTSTAGATVPVFLGSFVTSEGLYWAKLSAAATLASLPVIIVGWIAQRQLVRGLSMGAIK